MPLIKVKKHKNYKYGLWHIEEKLDSLIESLKGTKEELNKIEYIKHTQRRKQNIAARLILNALSKKKTELSYSKFGSPKCKEFNYISVSHSKDYCIVAVSQENIGVDIQNIKPNINQLSDKFLNESEIKNNNSIIELHFTWCAKEAIYKTLSNKPCSFKKNININSSKNAIKTIGYYKNKQELIKYNIEYEKICDYFIAIATKKND